MAVNAGNMAITGKLTPTPNIDKFGDSTLDIPAKELSKNDQIIKLSPKEFGLIEFFLENHGQLTCNEILNRAWQYNSFTGQRSIDRFVTILRNKIETYPHNPTFIHTIHKVGYKFDDRDMGHAF